MPKNVHVMRYLSYLQWKLNLETSLLHRQWKESSGNNVTSAVYIANVSSLHTSENMDFEKNCVAPGHFTV